MKKRFTAFLIALLMIVSYASFVIAADILTPDPGNQADNGEVIVDDNTNTIDTTDMTIETPEADPVPTGNQDNTAAPFELISSVIEDAEGIYKYRLEASIPVQAEEKNGEGSAETAPEDNDAVVEETEPTYTVIANIADQFDVVVPENAGYTFDETAKTVTFNDMKFADGKFTVEILLGLKDGFLGGKGVQLLKAESGVYSGENKIAELPQATVDVASEVEIVAEDLNLYLTSELYKENLTLNDFVANPDVANPDVKINGVSVYNNDAIADWQKEYIDYKIEVSSFNKLIESVDYKVSVDVRNKSEMTDSDNDGVADKPENIKKVTGEGKIYIFYPVITFKDTNFYYGESLESVKNLISASEVRYYDPVRKVYLENSSEITMNNAPSELKFDYTVVRPEQDSDGNITYNPYETDIIAKDIMYFETDVVSIIGSKAAIIDEKIDDDVAGLPVNGENITDKCYFINEKAEIDADQGTAVPMAVTSNDDAVDNTMIMGVNEYSFVNNPAYCTLEIKSQATEGTNFDENQSFLYEIKTKEANNAKTSETVDMTVASYGTGTSQITGLPVGEYTVKVVEDWSWQYDVVSVSDGTSTYDKSVSVILSADDVSAQEENTTANDTKVITFTQTKAAGKNWLGYDARVNNVNTAEVTE